MKQNSTEWLNNLRLLATIAVILLHTSAPLTLFQFNPDSLIPWWIGNIYNSLVRFCVPVFVMITGALMLPNDISLGHFFSKRIKRILLPFLFWSFIYIFYNYNIDSASSGINLSSLVKYSINSLLSGAEFHLWYIYMIIGLYLLIPIISGHLNKTNVL